MTEPSLLAISDLHVEVPENSELVDRFRPHGDGDWLIVCGDVGDLMADVEWGLRTLAERFDRLVWVPGNHELWTRSDDPSQLRGEQRYQHVVELCRGLGIATPEDPFPVWEGPGGPAIVAPLFTLYDYSFGRNIGSSKEESLKRAEEAGIVCMDEYVLFPDPHPSIDAWCRERVRATQERLDEAAGDLPVVLVSHFPLIREPTDILMFPEFAQWCGTVMTADWHRRYGAAAVVYGHLHIPRTTVHDGVPHVEVSVGYPRQWMGRRSAPAPRTILPTPAA